MKVDLYTSLLDRIHSRDVRVGIIGMGYVGLPLAIEFAKNGFSVTGFDVDSKKVKKINAAEGYIKHLPSEVMKEISSRKSCHATNDFAEISSCDCVIICVPTPLTKQREPQMCYINQTIESILANARKGQLIILESTTYPGTTRELVQAPFEEKGYKDGEDMFFAFSPEREDPGNPKYSTSSITKVVGADSAKSRKLASALYNAIISGTITVNSSAAAEATKLLENIFRSVNIALVNELKVLFDKMGIDVWEVIQAASTKPFGYMPFYPGPGLGGHCIPIDPFYLTWKAREFNCTTRFIELAGEINTAMPEYVVGKLVEALNGVKKAINGSRILLLGIAYKADVDDDRESPSLRLIELLQEAGAKVSYYDPHVPEFSGCRKYNFTMKSVKLTPATIKKADAVLISTAHSEVDYQLLADEASIIVDTRNIMAKFKKGKAKTIKA